MTEPAQTPKAKIAVRVADRDFASINSAAKEYGVSLQTTARRLRDGWTPEQAFGLAPPPERHHAGKKVVTSQGTFASVAEAAAHFKVDAGTLVFRLANGWHPDEAVGLVHHKRTPQRRHPVVCEGKEFPNVAQLAVAYGLTGHKVAKRLAWGWTLPQAVGVEPPPPRLRDKTGASRPHAWKSVEVIDARDYPGGNEGDFKLYLLTNRVNAKEYVGVTVTSLDTRLRGHRHAARIGQLGKLYNAMRRYGIENFTIQLLRNDAKNFAELQRQETDEIARRGTLKNGYNISPGGSVGTPDPIKVGTMQFASRAAAADYFGIDATVFNVRIGRLRWTPEQAAEIEPRPKFARRKVTVAGKSFASLKSAAEHFGIDYGTVHSRVVRDGLSVEQALGVAPPPSSRRVRNRPVTAFGRTFSNLNRCAIEFGVKTETLRQRIKNRGDEIERAIAYLQTKPKPGARKKGKE